MKETVKKILDWNGWRLIWAVLKSVPIFLFKTKTGRALLLALLTKLGVSMSGEELAVILDILFYLIVGNGIVRANEPVSIIKDIFQTELAKLNKGKEDATTLPTT